MPQPDLQNQNSPRKYVQTIIFQWNKDISFKELKYSTYVKRKIHHSNQGGDKEKKYWEDTLSRFLAVEKKQPKVSNSRGETEPLERYIKRSCRDQRLYFLVR